MNCEPGIYIQMKSINMCVLDHNYFFAALYYYFDPIENEKRCLVCNYNYGVFPGT